MLGITSSKDSYKLLTYADDIEIVSRIEENLKRNLINIKREDERERET